MQPLHMMLAHGTYGPSAASGRIPALGVWQKPLLPRLPSLRQQAWNVGREGGAKKGVVEWATRVCVTTYCQLHQCVRLGVPLPPPSPPPLLP